MYVILTNAVIMLFLCYHFKLINCLSTKNLTRMNVLRKVRSSAFHERNTVKSKKQHSFLAFEFLVCCEIKSDNRYNDVGNALLVFLRTMIIVAGISIQVAPS